MHVEARKLKSPRATAVHEAGHAIVALMLDAKVISAELGWKYNAADDELSAGRVRYEEPTSALEASAISLGGMVAETLVLGRCRRASLKTDRKNIARAAGQMIAEHHEKTRDEMIRWLVDRGGELAVKVLTACQHHVEAVANALLERGRLTGDEIRELVGI